MKSMASATFCCVFDHLLKVRTHQNTKTIFKSLVEVKTITII